MTIKIEGSTSSIFNPPLNPNPELSLKTHLYNSHQIIKASGRWDANARGWLQQTIEPLTQTTSTHFIIDCSQVDYMSSSGFRDLLQAQKTLLYNHQTLHLTNLQPRVLESFQLVGFDQVFSIFDNLDSALESTQS